MFPMGMVTQRMTQGRWRSKQFTASTTWTVPPDVGCVWLEGCAGGGGGGGGDSTPGGGGGGGCSGEVLSPPIALAVLPGESLTVTIGAAGTGGPINTNGTVGGRTSIVGTHGAFYMNSAFLPGQKGSGTTGGASGAMNGGNPVAAAGGTSGSVGAMSNMRAASTNLPYGHAFASNMPKILSGGGGGGLNANGGTCYSANGEQTYAGGLGSAAGGGGGRGGGNPRGIGGAGGAGGAAGGNATGYGAGGGGGGGNAAGGDGSPGMILIYCFTAYEI